jgi:hypothetical protein
MALLFDFTYPPPPNRPLIIDDGPGPAVCEVAKRPLLGDRISGMFARLGDRADDGSFRPSEP